MMESIFFNPWIWIAPILCGIALATLALGIIVSIATCGDSIGAVVAIAFGGVVSLILVPIYFAVILPPYDASYYHTYRVTGGVTSLEAAFDGEEGTMSQTFVATVEGVDYFINSSDQRFRTVDVGDHVTLTCTKGWDYFVDPWLDCRFGG